VEKRWVVGMEVGMKGEAVGRAGGGATPPNHVIYDPPDCHHNRTPFSPLNWRLWCPLGGPLVVPWGVPRGVPLGSPPPGVPQRVPRGIRGPWGDPWEGRRCGRNLARTPEHMRSLWWVSARVPPWGVRRPGNLPTRLESPTAAIKRPPMWSPGGIPLGIPGDPLR
jgi:hypothetical protein